MLFSLSRLAAGSRQRVLRPKCLRTLVRLKQHAAVAATPSSGDLFAHLSKPSSQLTFEELGVREPIVKALQVAYPDVRFPTTSQSEFIPAILSGRDVLLKDATGTGKSFGVILALLNKPRIGKPDRAAFDTGAKPPINSLIIVPHRDLALQLYHWIQTISAQLVKSPLTSISSLAHVLVRGAGISADEQVARLRADPPHMVIGTPQALLEVLERDRGALQLQALSTVVVDEVDYLIEGAPRKTSEWNRLKRERKERAHPNQTGRLLDAVFAAHAPKPQHAGADDGGDERWAQRPARERRATRPPPQLVLASATLRTRLKMELLAKEGWLTRGAEGMAQVTGKSVHKKRSQFADGDAGGLGGNGIVHCVLVASPDGQARNIPGALEPVIAETQSEEKDFAEELLSIPEELIEPFEDGLVPKKPLPFSPALLEIVATSFALDVPRSALLVVPANAPVQAIVQELRELGVNAHGLDLLADDRGRAHLMRGASDVAVANPTLLVSTLASTRGLDLPELSHVFILGLPDARRVDPYLHAAGRVGRFGRGGKVVTVLEEPRETLADGKPVSGMDEVKRMANILGEAGIVPTKFEHFD